MSSWFASIALPLVLAGCVHLDTTVADNDHDGIADDRDDCPEVFDPGQLDRDGDGRGDACHACPVPVGYDLDGDGHDDGCDECIGKGPTLRDVDGDGIDDGCDPCIDGVDTTGLAFDLDHDGILDGCDACIGQGLDADHDGIDDACDPCLAGPPDDEDGDGIADACDDCPQDPVQPGTDTDGDGLGAPCDRDPSGKDRRIAFDGFDVDRLDLWSAAAGWDIAGGELVVAPGAFAYRTSAVVLRGRLTAEVALRFDPNLPTTATFTIAISANKPPTEGHMCNLDAGGELTADATLAATTINPDMGARLRLRGVRDISGLVVLVCEATDGHGGTVTASAGSLDDLGWSVDLVQSGASGAFEWLDAISELP